MTITVREINTEDVVLLNRYYDKRALSSLPQHTGEPFRFGQVVWAYDLIEMIDGKPSIVDIDKDLAELNNIFYTNDAVFTYINGTIHVKAQLPPDALKGDEREQFSTLGFLDLEGELLVVAATMPVWVAEGRGLDLSININTNIA
ncbi:hypothetical protein ACWU37_21110 (plasmid) [Photobacterium damselae subsp. damselae]